MIRKLSFAFLLLFCGLAAIAQQATISGYVLDSIGKPLADVNIVVIGTNQNTISTEEGFYSLKVDTSKVVELAFSYISRPSKRASIRPLRNNEKYRLDVQMEYSVTLQTFVFTEELNRDKVSVITIDPRTLATLPNISGSFEAILKTLPGVSSNNEMSSQYNVRGGNYDENLIYVNDIEIYRPFLPRSGQQEGLSFIHSELVQSVSFSAGGFEARYGDKLSSVLDIKYRDPKKFTSSINMSLLGVQAHAEGSSQNRRFTYLIGTRYWTNQYVVGTLDTKGDYQPSFIDAQTVLTYHVTDELNISALASYAQNKYMVAPQTRETTFGTVKTALALRMFFNGGDLMEYRTASGALSVNYQPNFKTKLKLYGSAFYSNENEYFTIEGAYRLEELETDFGKDNFGKSRASKGIGYFLNNARNNLQALVYNAGHRGYFTQGNHYVQWGAQIQSEQIQDKMNEWGFIDSLGFAKPSLVNGEIVVNDYINSNNNFSSYRINGYIQNSQTLSRDHQMKITYGVRSNWWSLNNENVISPRAQFSFEPNRKHNRAVLNGQKQEPLRKDITFKVAAGVYYQPPFYREFRRFDGSLNKNIRAQQSIHYIAGGDYNFLAWGRPFKFFAEAYYKQMSNLIPYEIDNVRIRYYAENIAEGYATGLDLRMNGEFVKGVESWASLSVMSTQEKIPSAIISDGNGNRITPGFVRRPTDQRVNASIMFQDYMPKFPSIRVYLNLVYGSGLPFGPPDRNRYGDTLHMPSYRRVDIGFLKILVDENARNKKGWKHYFKSALLGVEVFNLIDINNTISYLWIEDAESRTWAVPNYLTARRVNIRAILKF
ncbi:MAG: TonB-dependent receptor plug domain-containing protein [Bacteroidota bacterium]|nr:TonB-dependent receptor [Sphingobacteriales bacterium]